MLPQTPWVALIRIPGIGPRTFARLVARFGSPQQVLAAPERELVALGRLTQEMVTQIIACGRDLDQLDVQLAAIADDSIAILTHDSSEYPANLAACGESPPVLFVRGQITQADQRAVAVVGTRSPSRAAAKAAEQIAQSLAAQGVTVVSGLAIGIDTAAHRGALAAGGRTLAALGSGLRCIYPQRNLRLSDRIALCGALVSEVLPDTTVSAENLLARNRTIAGLSRAVVVVQSQARGGAIVAAQHARDFGRPVFCLDWPEPRFHEGTQQLLDMGAALLSSPDELVPLLQAAEYEPARQEGMW